MSTESTLPEAVRNCLENENLFFEPTWLAIDSDISLEGESHPQWLVANRSAISIVDREKQQVLQSVGWEDIQSVRTVSGVGSGLLQVKVDDRWRDLLRFSNSLAHRFHKVSRRLDLWAEDDLVSDESVATTLAELEAEGDFSYDPPKCPSCNLRLKNKDVSCPRCLQRSQILTRVWEVLRPHWKGGLILVLLTTIGVAAELVPPYLQMKLVDGILKQVDGQPFNANTAPGMKTTLLVLVLALAASRIMLSIVGVIKGRLSSVIGSGITCNLRLEMVGKLQKLAVSYYDRHHVGSMISRVAHDSEVLHGLMHQITGGFLLQIVKLVGVGIMLFALNPKLAMYTLIPVPLVIYGTWFFWQKVYPRYYRLWDASSKQMSALSGMLHGIRVVKSFAQEDREFNRFENAATHLRDWKLWVEYANARYSAVMQIVFSLGGLIVWYVGGLDMIGGSGMTLGKLVAYLAYLSMFYAPLGALSNFTTWLTSFLSGSKRVMELLDTPLDVDDPQNPADWSKPRGEIHFDNVTFGYDRNTPVLHNITFDVDAGEMIGIVGRSGSGKSTMVNLLGRFYDPQEGRITIDGHDIKDLSVQQLREHLGIVFQDSFLFRGTIWKNLSYGRPKVSIEDGLAAAKAAGAHDYICRKQLSYETHLGEGGSGLSGGEKQRLSIARTLLYDPKILVLDEATSNIDAESEKSIQEALDVLIKGRTTIAIAHRLSTLRNADRILVFDRGRMVEQGSHAELLSMEDGVYARLVKIQTQVTKDPNVDNLVHHSETNASTSSQKTASGTRQATSGGDDTSAKDASTTALLDAPIDKPIDKTTDAPTDSADDEDANRPALRWLNANQDQFRFEDGHITLQRSEDETPTRVFLIRTFPATYVDEFVSVRTWNEGGDDDELGIIRAVAEWPQESQDLIRKALDRRYLLRQIKKIHSLKLSFGFLEFDVETNVGRQQFTSRWTQSKALTFGDNGKLLIDTDDNRYVVANVDDLPPNDRSVFLQYVYW